MNTATTLYGHRLTQDGRIHGLTRCRVCHRTAREAGCPVRLCPFTREPHCDECQARGGTVPPLWRPGPHQR